ncbi:MAG TPA: TA system VapC family ribonuclease toxin [Bryobacteraceae bacterium]|nr:TA system VapC family ribonuclease toxin [Bryobacteraceae bacterium]
MRRSLPDVNLLIALVDPNHEFHQAAHDWFGPNRSNGWATCPTTENACLRILSRPAYTYSGITITAVRDILAEFTAAGDHEFWPDSVSLLNPHKIVLAGTVPKNLTDIYLLHLAVVQGGCLVTFDRGISLQSVIGSVTQNLHILSA